MECEKKAPDTRKDKQGSISNNGLDGVNTFSTPKKLVQFRIKTDITLPFDYCLIRDDIYQADANSEGIETADQNGEIEVINWDAEDTHKLFEGAPEPIYDNGLKFIEISEDGRGFNSRKFGEWKCIRCDYINYIEINGNGVIKEPFECQNDACGRKTGFTPLFPKELVKPIWKIPNVPMRAGAYEIFEDVRSYIKDHLVMKENEYDIMALWLMASWLVDDFNTAPYLLFIAPKSSGKTQALNVVAELGYRAFLTVSVTAAAIFRAADLWNITPLIDESEFQVNTEKPTESSSALYGLLNGGYKRGNNALRIEGEARIPTAFKIFGFKAIASTKIFLPTLESRSIIFNMAQGMPRNVLIDEERAQIIRSKLLYWRYSHLHKLPITQPDSKSGRLIEIFIPLFTTAQAFKSSSNYKHIIELLQAKIKEMEDDRKEEEKSSPEAQIIQAISDLEDMDGTTGISVKGIAIELKWADENDTKEFKKSIQRAGYLMKAMGLKTKKVSQAHIIDLIDEQTIIKLDELKRRYLNE